MKIYFVVGILLCIEVVTSLDNGLALTPPLGWMSWQRFRCITDCDNYPDECISEKLFMRTADAMVSEGYKDAGYEYIIIDDCWMEMLRDPKTDKLVPDRKRFPNGLNKLSDYIHSKGLKFGLYEDFGTHTCAGYPGVIDHMELDAQTFADWGVDYVKLDGCYAEVEDMAFGYPEFGRLLNKTGRPMVYSCSWPAYLGDETPDWEALKEHCNLWRNWDDIDDSWNSVVSISTYFAVNQNMIQPHGGIGHWNDPDMLVGNFGLSVDQAKSQMAIWAILAAPLLMSNDLDVVKQEFKEVLQNKNVLAVNQDRLGIQGLRINTKNSIETWARPITPLNSYAVAFVSYRTDGAPYSITVLLSDIGLKNENGYILTDLYDNEKPEIIVQSTTLLKVRINPTGVEFYKFTAL